MDLSGTTMATSSKSLALKCSNSSSISSSNSSLTASSSTGIWIFSDIYFATNRFGSDQIRENVLVKQYFCDIDIAHLISYNEELAHKLNAEPGDIIPLVCLLPEDGRLMRANVWLSSKRL